MSEAASTDPAVTELKAKVFDILYQMDLHQSQIKRLDEEKLGLLKKLAELQAPTPPAAK